MKTAAIILAAGSGTRLGFGKPKGFVELAGKEMFLQTLSTFSSHKKIAKTVLVVPKNLVAAAKKLTADFREVAVVGGGATRLDSLAAGLQKIENAEIVVVANAANPLTTSAEISAVVAAAEKFGAAAVGNFATSTVKKIENSRAVETLVREKIWLAETPQAVRTEILKKGLSLAKRKKIAATDELALAELAGISPRVLPADPKNRKITTAADFAIAENFLVKNESRVGIGQDSHPFSDSPRPLVLAGIQLAKTGGLAGNSDGDVVLHALVNAISSAVGGGSIGSFADAMAVRGVRDSRKYLVEILKKIADWRIENISIAIEAAKPRLEKKLPKMKASLAELLAISDDRVGITATSGEGLTAFGRGEGVQVFASILLKK